MKILSAYEDDLMRYYIQHKVRSDCTIVLTVGLADADEIREALHRWYIDLTDDMLDGAYIFLPFGKNENLAWSVWDVIKPLIYKHSDSNGSDISGAQLWVPSIEGEPVSIASVGY